MWTGLGGSAHPTIVGTVAIISPLCGLVISIDA
jgi:hypothetical protein